MIWRNNWRQLKPPLGARPILRYPLLESLVGWWLMREKGGVKLFDISGNGNNGIITNAVWAPGKFGPCLSFDGTGDYVDVGTLGDFGSTLGSRLNMAHFWVKTSTTTQMTVMGVNRNAFGYDTGIRIRLNTNHLNSVVSGKIMLEVHDEDNTYHRIATTNATTFNDGNWHHIMVVISHIQANCLIYVDGVSQAITNGANGSPDNFLNLTTGLAIGAYNQAGSYTDYYTGLVDNVMIFNRALTAGEIAQLYRDPFCSFAVHQLFDVPSEAPPEEIEAWVAWMQQDWFLRHGHKLQMPVGVDESAAGWFAQGWQDWWLRYGRKLQRPAGVDESAAGWYAWQFQDWWLRHGRPAQMPRPPREAGALWMDWSTQAWAARFSTGQFAKI